MVYENSDGRAEADWNRQNVTLSNGGAVATPPGYRIVIVETKSSAELRDLASFRHDLELAKVYADAFFEHVSDDKLQDARDPLVGLWNAAVVAYGRAFNSGVRNSARVSTEKLDDEEMKFHKYFLDLRNKHVAHAVNGYEDTTVIAYLTDSFFMPPAATRIGQVHHDLILDITTAPANLSALCEKLVRELSVRVKKLHSDVGRELHEMDINSIYALPDIVIPTSGEVGKSRRRK